MDNKEVLNLVNSKIEKEEKKLERINNLIKKQIEIDNKGKEAKQKEIAQQIDDVEEKKRLKSVKKENLFKILFACSVGCFVLSAFAAAFISPIFFSLFNGISILTLATVPTFGILGYIQERKTKEINETIDKLEADWKSVETEESEKMLHLEYKHSVKSKKINQLKDIRKTILDYIELEKKVERKNRKTKNITTIVESKEMIK